VAGATVAGWTAQACGGMNAFDVRFLFMFIFIRRAKIVMATFAFTKDLFQLPLHSIGFSVCDHQN
jgi:hypothetical protein